MFRIFGVLVIFYPSEFLLLMLLLSSEEPDIGSLQCEFLEDILGESLLEMQLVVFWQFGQSLLCGYFPPR